MTGALPESGQTTALVLVGLALLAIPTGLTLAQGIATSPTPTDSVITPTLPPLNMTVTPTETSNEPTETPPEGNATTLVVEKDTALSGGSDDCKNNYQSIQAAVDDASKGDTVVVCETSDPYQPPTTIDIERADLALIAHGDAVIQATGHPAIRANATGVSIRGFSFNATGTPYITKIGGKETLIQNNTIELSGDSTGILLSDGLSPESGNPDPTLGPATGTKVVNNTIHGTEETFSRGVFADADRTILRENTIYGGHKTMALRSSGNHTIIRNNEILYSRCVPGENCGRAAPPTVVIGKDNAKLRHDIGDACEPESVWDKSKHEKHNWAFQNHFINNYISQGPGLSLYFMGTGEVFTQIPNAIRGGIIRNNTFINVSAPAIRSNGALFQNNTIRNYPGFRTGMCYNAKNALISGNYIEGYVSMQGPDIKLKNNIITESHAFGFATDDVEREGGYKYNLATKNLRIINNTIIGNYGSGIEIRGDTLVTNFSHNRIKNNGLFFHSGVSIGGEVERFHHNNISNNNGNGVSVAGNISYFYQNKLILNGGDGVLISEGPQDVTYSVNEFHHNLIDNNQGLGINRENFDKTDGKWPILNATHNIWGCGGPSGGLEDPKTGRIANGTGDGLSAGDKVGVSNIHFDPFFVREDVTCPAMAQPTQTAPPTPTPTPSPTPTPTLTPTPTTTPAAGFGNGTGGSGGNGTGGTGEGTGNTGPSGEASTNSTGAPTTLTPPQSTITPTPPPTPTISPTPRVEPGFGVISWLVGTAILVTLVFVRKSRPAVMEDEGGTP